MTIVVQRPKLCFVAHFAYGALAGGTTGHVGGVERQTALMSRWFAAQGYVVSVVTWDEGQPDDIEIGGVQVLKLCRRDEGLPGLRFIHPRWTSLLRALHRADADIYYQNCGEYVTGQVALWCGSRKRHFVYSVASDRDCDPRLELMTLRERVLYRYGLRQADRVVVQTRGQQRMLREGFGRDSLVIQMPGHDMLEPWTDAHGPALAPRVLWMARVTRLKRPDRLVELARACPELEFDLVGPEDGTEYARDVLDRARAVANITVHGPARPEQVPGFLGRAMCLVSTSEWEGFPNTFLEAWSARVPVVSTVDPDAVITRFGLGTVVADFAEFAPALRRLATSAAERVAAGARARQYFVDHHSTDTVLPEFERVFLGLTSRPCRWEPRTTGGAR